MKPDGGFVARLNEVTHSYGAVRALDGISLDVPAGMLIGLVGPDESASRRC